MVVDAVLICVLGALHCNGNAFFLISIQAHKSEIHVDKYLGVPIELIDRAVYEGGENHQMHPTDEALLRDPVANKRK